jgi:hypothetical protein
MKKLPIKQPIEVDVINIKKILKELTKESLIVNAQKDKIAVIYGKAIEMPEKLFIALKDVATQLGYDLTEDTDWASMAHFQRTTYYYILEPSPLPF